VSIATPQPLDIEDCFGPGTPTAFSQCTPEWMLSGQVTLDAGGVILAPSEPDVTGAWSQPNGAGSIRMEFRTVSSNELLSVFEGTSVSTTCFEGVVTASPSGAFRACLH